jgi:molybdate transport repressor ModE-like protein
MSRHTTATPAYKEVTLQQLRSFCETVRLGSFSAAAAALGLSHPTIWNQVHALERRFETKLVETHARGCRTTEAGRRLAELAAPLVTGFASLEQAFRAAQAQAKATARLVIAATARILVEDFPECVVEFERRNPHVQLTLKELRVAEVISAVESGEADLGFTASHSLHPGDEWLQYEPCYELDVVLVVPNDHPLAHRRVVRPRDLCAYPLVNAPESFVDPTVMLALEKLGGLVASPRCVEAYHAATIRRYVELGFGIGLIGRVPSHRPQSDLCERSMSGDFGRTTVYVVRRKGALQPPHVRDFAGTVKDMLHPPSSSAGAEHEPGSQELGS